MSFGTSASRLRGLGSAMRYKELVEAPLKHKAVSNLMNYGEIGDRDDVDCSERRLTSLEGSPAIVHGSFNCEKNKLTSLVGAPGKVGGDFSCGQNSIKSLDGLPKIIGGSIDLFFNPPLKSLEGLPEHVTGNLNVAHCRLKTLEYCSQTIDGHFLAQGNRFPSLVGGPQHVGGNYTINESPELQSLEGGPKFVGGNVYIQADGWDVLHNIHKHFPQINGRLAIDGVVTKHLLAIFLIKGLQSFGSFNDQEAVAIVNKYLGQGRKGMMLAQAELVQNGFESLATL
jgi:hypothetical protein